MEDIISNTHAMDVTLLNAFQHNELGDDIDIYNTFFQIMKFTSTSLITKNDYTFKYFLDKLLMTNRHTSDA